MEINLGRVAFLDRGVYSALTSYNKWDFVTTVDSCYLYINTEPSIGEPITNTLYWKCIADGKPSTLAAAAANAVTELSEGFADEAEESKRLAKISEDNAKESEELAAGSAAAYNTNIDGGVASSVYGGSIIINGGNA